MNTNEIYEIICECQRRDISITFNNRGMLIQKKCNLKGEATLQFLPEAFSDEHLTVDLSFLLDTADREFEKFEKGNHRNDTE